MTKATNKTEFSFTNAEYEFDDIAEKIFFPIYDVIAEDLLEETCVTIGNMLDVGCGGGHLGFAVMDRAPFLLGSFLDLDETALRLAEARARERGLWDRCSFHHGNVQALPFEDAAFDLIVSRGSLGFWKNQHLAFREIVRVLAPGGKTYIGGGLGRPDQRDHILQMMDSYGLDCGEKKAGATHALSDSDYLSIAEELGCFCHIYNDDIRGHWIVMERALSQWGNERAQFRQ